MRIEVDRKELKSAITTARRTIAKGTIGKTLPALSSVLIRSWANDTVTITSTDLEVTTVVTLKADVWTTGALIVDAKALGAAVKPFTGERVTIECEADGEAMALRCNGACRSLPTSDPSEWPTVPDFAELSAVATYGVADFAAVTSSVLAASSRDETRFNLNGVYLESISGESIFTATDGHRLAQTSIGVPFTSLDDVKRSAFVDQPSDNEPAGLIVPRRAIDAVGKLGVNRAKPPHPTIEVLGYCTITRSNTLLGFRYGATTVYAQTIDGTYPNYRQVVPASGGPVVSVPREELASACRQLEGVNERSHAMRLEFWADRLQLVAEHPDSGRSECSIECRAPWDAEGFSIAFNAHYVLEAIEGFDARSVLIRFGAEAKGRELSPVVLGNGDDASRFAVVMPMRI